MANSVYFNGNIITVPGAYSAIDTSGMRTKTSADSVKVLALIGECTGGEPGAVQFFTEPTVARKALKSGDLLKACEKAWNPVSSTKEGVELGGAHTIACIRTNSATKAELNIYKTLGAEKPQIAFQSKDWGKDNNHRIKIQDGSTPGTKAITIHDQVNDVYENFDNLGRLFSIGYTGDQPYAELNIWRDTQNVMHFQTKVGADEASATEDINIILDPTVYKSMRSFVYDLQSYENYKVTSAIRYNLRLAVTDFDFIEKKDIKSTTENPAYNVTAVYADTAYYLALNSNLVEVTSYDRKQGEINNLDSYVYLTGGSEGISPASWVQFFDALSNLNIDYIVPLTGENTIHAELAQHIQTCSGVMGRERRGVVGGNIEETVNETIQRARDLNTSRMQVVHGGLYDLDIANSNQLTLYPPYILAAQHAGRAAFLPDGESATHDVYRMSAPEYQLEASDITKLIQAGCLAFEYVLNGNSANAAYVRLVQDITTDLMNEDSVHTERATGQLADSLNKEIRVELDNLLTGKRTSATDLVSATNRVISILQNRLRNGYIVAFKNVYLTKTGDTTQVDYSVAPAEVNNFTLITAHYYSQSLAVSGNDE